MPAVPRLHGPCNEHLAHVSNMVSTERKDVYTPLCDNEGYYAPLQCNNDTTSCWCVDRYGSMIKGTRMKGKLPVCGKSSNPIIILNYSSWYVYSNLYIIGSVIYHRSETSALTGGDGG